MKKLRWVGEMLFGGIIAVSVIGCATLPAKEHARELQSGSEREMTIGIVQKEIKKGMAQAEVAVALGSPNIVTKDQEGLETWVYDKIASEASYSGGERGIVGIIIGGKAAGAASQTQKTLTVIIKFKDGVVHDFSYHASKF